MSTKMITAQEAYNLAKPHYDEYISYLDKAIKEAATKGETEVIVREEPYSNWLWR